MLTNSKLKVIKRSKWDIKVVDNSIKEEYITSRDAAMDVCAKQAVREAVSKAEFCQKPVAKYDAQSKNAYLQYPDGRRKVIRNEYERLEIEMKLEEAEREAKTTTVRYNSDEVFESVLEEIRKALKK